MQQLGTLSEEKSLSEELRPSLSIWALRSRLERTAAMHKRALDMSSYIRENQPKSAITSNQVTRLDRCGHYLHFREYYQVEQVRLHRADFCMQHLLCPLCAARRGAKFVEKYMERTEKVTKENPELRPYLVTFTIKNGPDLCERYKHLHRSYRRMMQQRRNAKKGIRNDKLEICKAVGGVGAYEFKRGKNSDEWHPHGHNMWLCNSAPDPEKLSWEWKRITGDSHICDVTPFHDDPVNGFLEVGRYALKFSSMEIQDNYEAAMILAGRRLIQSFGSLYGVKIPDDLSDEQIEDQPYLDRLYIYHAKAQAYSFYPAQGDKQIHEEIKANRQAFGLV